MRAITRMDSRDRHGDPHGVGVVAVAVAVAVVVAVAVAVTSVVVVLDPQSAVSRKGLLQIGIGTVF